MKKLLGFVVVVVLAAAAFAACNVDTPSYAGELENNGVGRYTDIITEKTSNSNETMSEKNARRSAENYIGIMAFSRDGLVEQLVYDGYTEDEAAYGADNCGADWLEEAAESANNYLEIMPMSRSELYGQLEYDGFTAEQIEHALEDVGY